MASKLPSMESARSLLSEYRDSTSAEDETWKNCEELYENGEHVSKPRQLRTLIALIISLCINAGLVIFILVGSHAACISNLDCNRPDWNIATPSNQHATAQVSEFAGLARNVPTKWTYNRLDNEEDWANLWNTTRFYAGIISLSDKYARAKGLPRAQRWPWDPTRGLYLINGFHNLHCLSFIKTSLDEYREGLPQSVSWYHIQHCMLSLREDVMCNADDTPRYTGFQRPGNSGYGQMHMCRNWTQLEEWGLQLEQESCWRNPEGILGGIEGDTDEDRLNRFRFCSDESPYKDIASTSGKFSSDHEG